MLESVLIANRGEIACRVIRTARRLGLRTIAVYSEADRGALHTRLADEAVLRRPGGGARELPRRRAHPRGGAATRARGRSIPGYGFLSENAAFARACREAGVVFIGPPEDAILRMGSKSEARRLMAARRRAGAAGLRRRRPVAARGSSARPHGSGFPLLIKPTAGGGGKGMRIVRAAGELAEALAGARREAREVVRRRPRAARALRREGPARRDPGLRRFARLGACTCSSATARCSAATRR